MSSRTSRLFRGYIGETILAVLLYKALMFVVSMQKLCEILINGWGVFAGTAAGLTSIGFAGIIFTSQLFSSEFGKYMKWEGEEQDVYLLAYQVQSLLFFVSGVVIGAAAFSRNIYIIHFAWILIFYSFINVFTLIWNTHWLIRMNLKFRYKFDRARAETDDNVED